MWVDAGWAASGWESEGARDSERAISKNLKHDRRNTRLRWTGCAHKRSPTSYHGVISPSPRAQRNSAGPRKTQHVRGGNVDVVGAVMGLFLKFLGCFLGSSRVPLGASWAVFFPNQRTNQPTNQPSNQPTSQPTNQPTNGQRVHGVGLVGRFGGAAPVR